MAGVERDRRVEDAKGPSRPSSAAPLVLFVLLTIAIAIAGALSYAGSAVDLRRDRERELAAIAALKVDELGRWRQERLIDANAIAADPSVLVALGDGGPTPPRVVREIEAWLEVLRGVGEYSAVAILEADGRVRFRAGELAPGPGPTPPEVVALVRRALDERRAVVSELHPPGRQDAVDVTVVSPISVNGQARQVVLLRVDPYRRLFRMVQSWPTPSPTAETLLVRAEGERAVVVNEPRHGGSDPGRLPAPFTRADDPVARAALGPPGVFDLVDHRGVRVLAAVEPVPETAWRLVATLDADEALAPLASQRAWVLAGVLALIAAAGAGATVWWRAQVAAFERARLRAETERITLARRLEQLTKYTRDMVFVADDRHRLLEVNDRALALLGYAREALIGQPVRTLRDPATLADFEARTAEQVEDGSAVFETRYRRKDGSTFPVEVSAHTETVDGRRYFHAVTRDITERKLAEEALRASEEKFRAAFEFASLGILLAAPDGRLVETNRAMRRMLGRGEDPLRGETFEDIHAPPDRASAAAILRQLREGGVGAVELPRRLLRKDGSLAEVVLRASALRDDAGSFRFVLAVAEDVTEKKRLEAQLMLADRMASVGTLAAGVAHEINNPLAFILANLEFALDELRAAGGIDPDIPRALAEARDGGLRVREIVRDLKAFSRADTEEREAVDLRRVIQSALGLAQNEIRHRARLEVEAGDVPRVVGSEHRLGQVLLNLLINAAQSIPEGRATEHVVRAATDTAPDGRARVSISDTGSGIAPDVLPRIFDPFFTTKPVGVGTGLGLSICHGIVSGLGGEIQVESTPGKGSRFTVLLPPAPAGAQARTPATPARPPPPRRGRILVVDDEGLVGRAVVRILSPQHEVVARTSARAALEDVTRGERFDLVLCDLMMPDMTGMELHARLGEVTPALAERTVFLTGGAFSASAREFLARARNARIEKPFEPEQLRALVARVLAEQPLREARPRTSAAPRSEAGEGAG
jgi:PAS domain S-box-containing protein